MDVEETKGAKHCRICLEEEEIEDTDVFDFDKTFISPCRCKGTSKYVHVNCLKNWIKSKRQQKKPTPTTYIPRLLDMNMSIILNNPNALGLFRFSERLNLSAPFTNLNISSLAISREILAQYQRFQLDIQRNLMNLTNPMSPLANFDVILENGNSNGNAPQPESEQVIDLENPSDVNIPTQPNILNIPVVNSIAGLPQMNSQNSQENPAPGGPDPSKIENHEFSNFACDVCKDILPFVIKLNHSLEIETINIPRPENMPYLILERLSNGKEPKVFSVFQGKDGQKIQLVITHILTIGLIHFIGSRSFR